ncbi:hypothetical protein PLIIFM63780_003699 [Purpureocillium lilacinum]|uniref:Amidohydrolase family protein n=1 Tax=Purpureocillium lilacinum TaxID=33203 RepID=A0A179HC26_PURLI|nr:amidohydrolase family protein [Purpureocillium lilacinum]PWI71658.1 hypothetical protein PCL_11752 [Purpureocillium lilacinum]GJN66233.1 hypothetical protein PLICBS_000249 [Purpureocillium lilacinum]GJN80175.1 hypothetical protein PLIIFM63780_003699 [Purpureocillium lilacinum]
MAPQTIFVNARFLDTEGAAGPSLVNEERDCMVVSGSNISHLGRASDGVVHLARESGANTIDLRGRVVAPGFIDSHVHLLMFGASAQKLDLSSCTSLAEIRETISKFCAQNEDLPRILCKGWLQSMTDGLALASMLDDLDPRPIFVDAMDLHSVWCNTAALDLLPLAKMQEACGEFVTSDANGKPTGLIAEKAVTAFVWPMLASLSTMEENHACLDEAIDQYVAAGYTGVIDMAMDSNSWTALETYRDSKGIPFHVAAHWFIPYEEDRKALLDHVDEAIEMHRRWHPSRFPEFCVIGVKLMCDGTVDGCTAALSYPYGNDPDFVKPIWPADAMELVVKRASDAGLQIAIHAIGDAAVTQAIEAIAKADAPQGRHRIEHLELASVEDAKRLGRLGITASIQPVHSDPAILKGYANLIDPSTFDAAFPYREMAKGNACVAIGTDAPTARHLPFPNLYNACTRRSALDPSLKTQTNPKSALSLGQALSGATAGAAYSRFAEKWTGSLKTGLQADFIVIDEVHAPDQLQQTRICETWARGKLVYAAKQ